MAAGTPMTNLEAQRYYRLLTTAEHLVELATHKGAEINGRDALLLLMVIAFGQGGKAALDRIVMARVGDALAPGAVHATDDDMVWFDGTGVRFPLLANLLRNEQHRPGQPLMRRMIKGGGFEESNGVARMLDLLAMRIEMMGYARLQTTRLPDSGHRGLYVPIGSGRNPAYGKHRARGTKEDLADVCSTSCLSASRTGPTATSALTVAAPSRR
jgi:hypothetical protein